MAKRKGKIVFDKKNIARKTPQHVTRAGITYVPQGRSVFTELTVHENIEMGAYLKKGNLWKDFKRVSAMFPDLIEPLRKALKPKWAVVDGELVAIDRKAKKPMPFQEVLKRRRKYEIKKTIEQIPIEELTPSSDVLYQAKGTTDSLLDYNKFFQNDIFIHIQNDRLLKRYNATYCLENTEYKGHVHAFENVYYSELFQSLHSDRYPLYSNEHVRVWEI